MESAGLAMESLAIAALVPQAALSAGEDIAFRPATVTAARGAAVWRWDHGSIYSDPKPLGSLSILGPTEGIEGLAANGSRWSDGKIRCT